MEPFTWQKVEIKLNHDKRITVYYAKTKQTTTYVQHKKTIQFDLKYVFFYIEWKHDDLKSQIISVPVKLNFDMKILDANWNCKPKTYKYPHTPHD